VLLILGVVLFLIVAALALQGVLSGAISAISSVDGRAKPTVELWSQVSLGVSAAERVRTSCPLLRCAGMCHSLLAARQAVTYGAGRSV
jgi:hypothetical protein